MWGKGREGGVDKVFEWFEFLVMFIIGFRRSWPFSNRLCNA